MDGSRFIMGQNFIPGALQTLPKRQYIVPNYTDKTTWISKKKLPLIICFPFSYQFNAPYSKSGYSSKTEHFENQNSLIQQNVTEVTPCLK